MSARKIARQRRRIAGDIDDRGAATAASSAVISAPRPVRGGSTTIRSGRAPLVLAQKVKRLRIETALPLVPRRFSSSAAIAAGADSTATTRAKLAVKSCAQTDQRPQRDPTPARRCARRLPAQQARRPASGSPERMRRGPRDSRSPQRDRRGTAHPIARNRALRRCCSRGPFDH